MALLQSAMHPSASSASYFTLARARRGHQPWSVAAASFRSTSPSNRAERRNDSPHGCHLVTSQDGASASDARKRLPPSAQKRTSSGIRSLRATKPTDSRTNGLPAVAEDLMAASFPPPRRESSQTRVCPDRLFRP